MLLRPTRSTVTDTLFPNAALCRSVGGLKAGIGDWGLGIRKSPGRVAKPAIASHDTRTRTRSQTHAEPGHPRRHHRPRREDPPAVLRRPRHAPRRAAGVRRQTGRACVRASVWKDVENWVFADK